MAFLGGLFGGETKAERDLRKFSTASFESPRIQGFLPGALQTPQIGPILTSGVQGIGNLISHPGGLSPTVSEAILPRLAAESGTIAENFRGIRSQQEGAAARGNLPISIKSALSSALDVAEERAQRGSRQNALAESEQLRRLDVGHIFDLLQALLHFTTGGRATAIQGLGASAQSQSQRQAAMLSAIGSILSSLAMPTAAAGAVPAIAGSAGTAGTIAGIASAIP